MLLISKIFLYQIIVTSKIILLEALLHFCKNWAFIFPFSIYFILLPVPFLIHYINIIWNKLFIFYPISCWKIWLLNYSWNLPLFYYVNIKKEINLSFAIKVIKFLILNSERVCIKAKCVFTNSLNELIRKLRRVWRRYHICAPWCWRDHK